MPISSFGGFYNPNSTYGAERDWDPYFPNWQGSNAFLNQVESAPEGAWSRRLAELGLGGLDDRSSFARGLMNRALAGWEAAKLKNPGMRLWDFMSPDNLDINAMVAGTAPEVRGERTSNITVPSRWTQRVY